MAVSWWDSLSWHDLHQPDLDNRPSCQVFVTLVTCNTCQVLVTLLTCNICQVFVTQATVKETIEICATLNYDSLSIDFWFWVDVSRRPAKDDSTSTLLVGRLLIEEETMKRFYHMQETRDNIVNQTQFLWLKWSLSQVNSQDTISH